MDTKTSLTDPLYVTWLHAGPEDAPPRFGTGGVRALRGRVGITFAPGKRSDGLFVRARWERDLALDLDALVAQQVGLLVCLLEDPELTLLGIPDLIARASERMRVLRLPIPDGGLPPDGAAVRAVVSEVVRHAEAGTKSAADPADSGDNVVIHCRGGLGRAGTIGGCVLRAIGLSADETFARLRRRHAKSCPETEAQRAYVRAFAPELFVGDGASSRDAAHDASSHGARDVASSDDAAPDAGSHDATSIPSVVAPVPGSRHDRVAGAVLAAAIGDALGHPTEFLTVEAIHARFGPEGVRGFELFLDERGRRVAPFTDDTQMSELVIEALLEELERADGDAHVAHASRARSLELDRTMLDLARRFVAWSHSPRGGHRAPGNACLAGCRALERGVPWREAGGPTAGGCGSVMRAWPFGLVFDDLSEAERWAVEHSKLTHRDPIALAACAAVVWGVGLGLRGHDVDETARAMIDAASRWSEPTASMMKRAHDEARDGTPPGVTLDRLRGWAAHEAIAGALYVLVRHPDDPRAALLEGANTPGDSDSLASIAGALVGVRVGLAKLPPEWVRDVERSSDLLAYAARLARARA
jgi:ADP-ribosylglycohydrolase/protein-tyrosine phosphatase